MRHRQDPGGQQFVLCGTDQGEHFAVYLQQQVLAVRHHPVEVDRDQRQVFVEDGQVDEPTTEDLGLADLDYPAELRGDLQIGEYRLTGG